MWMKCIKVAYLLAEELVEDFEQELEKQERRLALKKLREERRKLKRLPDLSNHDQ